MRELKLSESVALNFINVARKSIEIPALKAEIALGNMTVSKARKIVPVLNLENQSEWIEKAKALPQRKLEKEVARIAPKAGVPEKVNYLTEDRLHLSLSVGEKLMQKLRRIQDLESQRKKQAVSLEEAMDVLSDLYLQKNDPLEKAKRAQHRTQKAVHHSTPRPTHQPALYPAPKQTLSSVARQINRVAITAALKHQINLRDNAQCTYVDYKGDRCNSRRWLDIHHIKPISCGGTNVIDNLATLCFAHHKIVHQT